MRKNIIKILILLFFLPSACFAIDLKGFGEKMEQFGLGDVLEMAETEVDKVAQFLNWETINVSFKADMTSTTDSLGRQAVVDSRIYKKGLSGIRMEVKGEMKIPGSQSPVKLGNFYMLQYLLKKEGYLVLPLKKTYMELDPDRGRELFGQLKERMDEKSSTIEKKEVLGTETLDGYLCDKAHVIMILENGTRCDVTAWLAKKLKNFPLKTVLQFETVRGITGTNITLFKNIEEMDLETDLFEIPGSYTKCKNLLELTSGGKFGSRLKKKKRGKLFNR